MRVLPPEIMDDPANAEADFTAALADLERINRMSFAYAPVLAWLDRLAGRLPATGAPLSILDVGAGGGDMLRRIAAWAARRGRAVTLTGLDRSPWARRHAAARGTPAAWIEADLFAHEGSYDAVLCSLFAHHFEDPEVVRLLRWMAARARSGWLISDLHRHPLPQAAVWAGTRLLRMHPMVAHDGPASIRRGFSRADWDRLVAEAGVPARVRWVLPFRWLVTDGG